ncbi:MAG TPA: hypothetical protein VF961_09750, partial [Pyrinomonadaceae bacterium]
MVQRLAILFSAGPDIGEPANIAPAPSLTVILEFSSLTVVILAIGANTEINGDSWFHLELESLKIIPIFRDVSPFEGPTDFQALKNFRFSATSASHYDTNNRVQKMKVKKTRWQMLQERYNKRGIAVVLGAGVSSGCNLPDWPDLLRRMARLVFGNETTVVEDLSGAGWSLPSVAS